MRARLFSQTAFPGAAARNIVEPGGLKSNDTLGDVGGLLYDLKFYSVKELSSW